MTKAQTTVLYVATDEISMRDLPEGFFLDGYQVLEYNRMVKAKGYSEEECSMLLESICTNGIGLVLTYDFIVTVAQACHRAGCSYVSWVYDCPQAELYTEAALYDTNHIFVFDKREWNRLRNAGLRNVYRMPLAVSAEKIVQVLGPTEIAYHDEVSFVGQLYSTKGFAFALEGMPEETRAELEKATERFAGYWPDKRDFPKEDFHGAMPDAAVAYLGELEAHKVKDAYPLMTEKQYYEAAVFARMIANKERTEILNRVSEIAPVALYTRDTDLEALSPKVEVKPGVGFDREVLGVYQNSKINLNVTLHCIESGLPQRILDVLGCGGFLLTNYQKELEDYFEIGKDLEVYHSYEELEEKVAYYLEHEEECRAIAASGQQKVLGRHSFRVRVGQIADILNRYEVEREIPVIIMTTPDDFKRMQPIQKDMLKNLYPRKVTFLGRKEVGELLAQSDIAGEAGFLDEDTVLPFDRVHALMKEALGVEELPRGITGWYYQQFLKMEYAYHCEGDYYMTWDGDTVPCVPFSMYGADLTKPCFDFKSEYHSDYFETIGKLFPGMDKVIKGSFISEHMQFHTGMMRQLIEDIEAAEHLSGERFYERIIRVIPKEKLTENSFSEFETYGTYVALKFFNSYRMREWHSFRYGGAFLHPEKMTDEDYMWLAGDFDAISFEKNQSVREDHEQLFQNEEYQSKLSARQMLEIVQETFEEGLVETWS